MARILIIVPRANSRFRYDYTFPLGLGYISAVLKKSGHKVDCLNLNHRTGEQEEIISASLNNEEAYDFICSGGHSVDFKKIKRIIDSVRSVDPSAKIILGGALVSAESEVVYHALRPDYIVIGEGEETVAHLVRHLEDGLPLEKVASIGFCSHDGTLKITESRPPIKDIDSIPWPDFQGLEFEQYLNNTHPDDQCYTGSHNFPRVYGILGSRSCPFLCTFCFHVLGNVYRQRSIDSILQELEVGVRKYKINTIILFDDLFSTKQDRVYEFCRRIKSFLEQIPWECRWFCDLRVDAQIDDDLLESMKDAGCYMITYGLESYHPDVLKSMRKKITPRQIDYAVRATVSKNIAVNAAFILGDVAETGLTARTTINAWKRLSFSGIQLNFIYPYPGSVMYQQGIQRGIIKDQIDYIENQLTRVHNFTENMSEIAFKNMQFDVWLVNLLYRSYGVVSNFQRMQDDTFSFKAQCPQCKHIGEYSNFLNPLDPFGFGVLCQACNVRFSPITKNRKNLIQLLRCITPFLPRNFKKFIFMNRRLVFVKTLYRRLDSMFHRFFSRTGFPGSTQ